MTPLNLKKRLLQSLTHLHFLATPSTKSIWYRLESANKDADDISHIGVDFSINPTVDHYYKIEASKSPKDSTKIHTFAFSLKHS